MPFSLIPLFSLPPSLPYVVPLRFDCAAQRKMNVIARSHAYDQSGDKLKKEKNLIVKKESKSRKNKFISVHDRE